jgi:hypothetical protein
MANQKPDAGQFDDVGFLIFGELSPRWPNYPAERDGPTFAYSDRETTRTSIKGHLDI